VIYVYQLLMSYDNPSICIPFVFPNIKKEHIRRVFEELKLGEIEFIDIHVTPKCQRVYIYFKSWCSGERVDNIKTRLLQGEELKVIYNNPWYWKCYLNNRKQPTNNTGTHTPSLRKRFNQLRHEYKIMLDSKNAEIKALYELINELSDGKITNLDTLLLRRKHTQQRIANM